MAHFVGYKSTTAGTNLTVTESSFYALVTSLVTNEGVFGTGMIVEATSPVSGQVRVNDGYIIVDSGAGFDYLAWSRNTLGYELVNVNPNNDPTNSRRDLLIYHIDTTAVLSSGGGGKFVVVQGTASASPVDPNLTTFHDGTTKYAVPIARITLPPSTPNINSGMISQSGNTNNATIEPIRPLAYIENSLVEAGRFADLAGAVFSGNVSFTGTSQPGFVPKSLTTAQRNALVSIPDGATIFNTDTGALETYNGTGWVGGLSQKQINATNAYIAQNFY